MVENKILIVGSLKTTHIRRLIHKLGKGKKSNESISVLDTSNSWDYKYDPVEGINQIWGIQSTKISKLLFKIPKIRALIIAYYAKKKFKEFESKEHFNIVSFQGVDFNTERLVSIAHRFKSITHIVPLGSDVLRSPKFVEPLLQKAFKKLDFISVYKESDFGKELLSRFRIPNRKIVRAGYGSDVIDYIDNLRWAFSKEEMALLLKLPKSSYYISCGYNANIEQNHEVMLRALAENKDLLPKDFCIIVQLSYGIQKVDLIQKIPSLAQSLGLNVCLITDFLTIEQVAALRLLTDLFIHVQTTDASNASILEYLLADTQVINGAWLKYGFIEKNTMPYHICKSIDNLDVCLRSVLSGETNKIIVSEETKQIIRDFKSWKILLEEWHSFFAKGI